MVWVVDADNRKKTLKYFESKINDDVFKGETFEIHIDDWKSCSLEEGGSEAKVPVIYDFYGIETSEERPDWKQYLYCCLSCEKYVGIYVALIKRQDFINKVREDKLDFWLSEQNNLVKEKQRKIEEKKFLAEQEEKQRRRKEDFEKNLKDGFVQQETMVYDEEGTRWIRCKYCGKIAKSAEFVIIYGGTELNLGKCRECRDNQDRQKQLEIHVPEKQHDPTVCPVCGGKLVEKNGAYGRFVGCSNYPKCRYTRSVKKGQ